jgi:ADP-ribose pyrophosphatase YjhB (NUDIX family)
VTLKHDTSSVFVFRRLADGWRIGLIRHPRLHRMMIPGGHVEPEESCAEAALREVAEETGLAVMLVGPPAAPVPRGYRGRRVALPWWIAEYQVAADNHLGVAHIHVDHLYVALADGAMPRGAAPAGAPAPGAVLVPNPAPGGTGVPGAAEHPFAWYAAEELAGLNMFDDARVLALSLLAGLADGADRTGPGAALVAGLSRA